MLHMPRLMTSDMLAEREAALAAAGAPSTRPVTCNLLAHIGAFLPLATSCACSLKDLHVQQTAGQRSLGDVLGCVERGALRMCRFCRRGSQGKAAGAAAAAVYASLQGHSAQGPT
jgi:hypothetical protein